MRIHAARFVLPLALVLFAAGAASAHCCHDSRAVRTEHQNDGLRPGLHGMGDELPDDAIEAEPPTIDEGLQRGAPDDWSVGGLGSMRGNGIGNYGAGSIGQAGPGGLGAMRNGGLGGPVRPR